MEKILIVGPSWVGDMVMTQSLFKVLKNNHANTMIDVLAPDWSAPLLARMPEIHRILSLPFSHGETSFKQRYRLGKSLRAEKYDRAIVLPISWKSAIVAWAANIPLRTGLATEMRYGLLNDLRRLDAKKYPRMIDRLVALGLPKNALLPESFSLPVLQINEAHRSELLRRFQLILDKPILVLCPGAEFGAAKRWPAEYFAQLAQEKIQQGWQVWLLGSPKDEVIARTILSVVPQHLLASLYSLIGKTQLVDAVDLLSLADVVVSNDSGLMHVAAALNRRVIGLYGATSPVYAPPLNHQSEIIFLDLPCSPCRKRECPLQHHHCMRQIKVEKINQCISSIHHNDQVHPHLGS